MTKDEENLQQSHSVEEAQEQHGLNKHIESNIETRVKSKE